MKIISWNVNGLRSVYRKNFLDWFLKTQADIVCLQEIRVQTQQVPGGLLNDSNHFNYFNFGARKGYGGVAVFTKQQPLKVSQKLGMKRFDQEGRILILEYPAFTLINLYLPHGGRGKENLGYKLEVYQNLLKYLQKLKNKKAILIGDFNIAHKEADLARPKQNKRNIMFTPEERKQLDQLVSLGFVDSFRKFNQESGHFSWWPYFRSARKRNLGWRIDYAFVSKVLAPNLKNAFILPEVLGSDHCPIGIII